jgi:hypothetical protein
METACTPQDVFGVAFNIPHGHTAGWRPYDAPPGEFVPEVRCGLLDLARLKANRPWPNREVAGALELSWYRSLQQHQRLHYQRTLRGGDPRTSYIHPPNSWKQDWGTLRRVRDLIEQGRVPDCQHEKWDLAGTASDWVYPKRSEQVVVLAKGRNTPHARVRRFAAGLKMQDDQDFGVVVIDDGSEDNSGLPSLLSALGDRLTLIRRPEPLGRIPNFIEGVTNVCVDPEALVVVVDLDDALMHPGAISRLRNYLNSGHDLVIGAMYRPDKPLKSYYPNFSKPRRAWGGEVWVHLRAFKKRLFDAIPHEHLRIDGEWIDECTDYATMIPMVELCSNPAYLPEYLYYHQRTTPRTQEARVRKDALIARILSKQPVRRASEKLTESGVAIRR